MNEITNKVIDLIKKNRISTTEVADALNKTGEMPLMIPIHNNLGELIVGQIYCVFSANESNYEMHEQIADIPEERVIVIFTENCKNRAILGALVAKYLFLYKQSKAILVDGTVRDVAQIKREGYKIWAKGFTPIGCVNTPADAYNLKKQKELRNQYNDGIAICDDGGIILIEKKKLTEELYNNLINIENQEDIWFFCLDHLKWNTKEIVCDKKYLFEKELLPNHIIKKVK